MSIGKLNPTVVISPVLAGTVPLFLAYFDRAPEFSDYVPFFLKINFNNEKIANKGISMNLRTYRELS